MDLQVVKVSACYESETNPRGTDFEDKAFSELVDSVKEKGVLVPILLRPKSKGGKQYEVVAGNRRFRASQKAGLDTIPAHIKEMTDDEALEAQIVENLQRSDVHPLEEGEAYRKLIEGKGFDVKVVALRVGKSETYVRGRLFLTNLCDAAAKKYRKGEFSDGHAVLIAKLTPDEQKTTLAEAFRWREPSVSELKDWIVEEFYKPLEHQPWLKDAEAAQAVGPCTLCPANRPTLFGEIKEGQCVDLKCWRKKMAAYLEFRKMRNPDVVLISTHYNNPEQSGVLSKSAYETLPAQKKKHCDFAQQGLVVEGENLGNTIWICRDERCKEHGDDHTVYQRTPEEKENRKKEREKEKAKEQKHNALIRFAVDKVQWPLSEKHLDALFDIILESRGTSFTMPVVKRLGLEPDKKKGEYGTYRDYEAPLRRFAEQAGAEGKMRMIFELFMPSYSTHYGGEVQKLTKRF